MITPPSKDEPLRLSWGVAVTAAVNRMQHAGMPGTLSRDGAGAFGNAPLPENGRNRRTVPGARPFEVRWRSDVGDEGGLAIYLPNDHLLMVGGEYADIGGTGDELEDAPGWYEIEDATEESTHVWLTVETEDDVTTAKISCEDGGSGDATRICIAEITPGEQGQHPTVVQSVVGALVLGTGGGGSEQYASGTVVTSVDYVSSTGDPDYGAHAYSIRIKRGRLEVVAGAITVIEDANLTQYIATTPHTAAMDNQS